jgi:archaetidylserine synthase
VNESIYRLIRLPDIVTLLNTLLGLTAILMVVQNSSNAINASILIVLAVMADGLDGVIARKLESGVLGEQLDSLADVISFGVAPVAIVYSMLAPQYHYWICITGGTFLVCGVLRLARFNAINFKDGFAGLPITTSGLAVPLYILAFRGFDVQSFSYSLLALIVFLAGLMISSVPYVKIRNFKVLGVASLLLLLMILFFYLGDVEKTQALAGINFILIGLYILSPILKLKEILRK